MFGNLSNVDNALLKDGSVVPERDWLRVERKKVLFHRSMPARQETCADAICLLGKPQIKACRLVLGLLDLLSRHDELSARHCLNLTETEQAVWRAEVFVARNWISGVERQRSGGASRCRHRNP